MEIGLLMSSDIESARVEADATGEGVIDTLVKQGIIASSQVATAKAAQLGVEFIPLGEMKIADDAIAAVPRHVARRFNVVPVFKTETGVVVALADPSDLDALDGLQHSINMDVEARVATPEDIEAALNRYYGGGGALGHHQLQQIGHLIRHTAFFFLHLLLLEIDCSAYSTSAIVPRITSSHVVRPAKTLRVPSSRKVRMPISRARARSTVAGTFS